MLEQALPPAAAPPGRGFRPPALMPSSGNGHGGSRPPPGGSGKHLLPPTSPRGADRGDRGGSAGTTSPRGERGGERGGSARPVSNPSRDFLQTILSNRDGGREGLELPDSVPTWKESLVERVRRRTAETRVRTPHHHQAGT